jgi:hypothetical protein
MIVNENELIQSLSEIEERLKNWEKGCHLVMKTKYNRDEVEALAKIFGYSISSFKVKSKVYYNLVKSIDGKETNKIQFNNLKEIVDFLIK